MYSRALRDENWMKQMPEDIPNCIHAISDNRNLVNVTHVTTIERTKCRSPKS